MKASEVYLEYAQKVISAGRIGDAYDMPNPYYENWWGPNGLMGNAPQPLTDYSPEHTALMLCLMSAIAASEE